MVSAVSGVLYRTVFCLFLGMPSVVTRGVRVGGGVAWCTCKTYIEGCEIRSLRCNLDDG